MKIEIEPQKSAWEELCKRPADANPVVRERVEAILARVRERGDEALKAIAGEIDGFVPESFEVSAEEIEAACRQVSDDVKQAIRNAAANIEAFHRAQLPKVIEVETQKGVRRAREALVRADNPDVVPHEAPDLVPHVRHEDRLVRRHGTADTPVRDFR